MQARLRGVSDSARGMALDMSFAFLRDPERKLLWIGYGLADNSLDPSCYDLLASEARLASLFAIAKGDVTTRHWFRLGRTAIPIGSGSALSRSEEGRVGKECVSKCRYWWLQFT